MCEAFESSAILSGSKTFDQPNVDEWGFESSAILSGSKTFSSGKLTLLSFESSAILSGSKTDTLNTRKSQGLRVVQS